MANEREKNRVGKSWGKKGKETQAGFNSKSTRKSWPKRNQTPQTERRGGKKSLANKRGQTGNTKTGRESFKKKKRKGGGEWEGKKKNKQNQPLGNKDWLRYSQEKKANTVRDIKKREDHKGGLGQKLKCGGKR